MEYWTILLYILMSVLGIYYSFRSINYFKRNGILYVPPVFGIMPVLFRRISIADYLQKLYYFKPNAKYFGFYAMMRPVILLREPKLIEEVFNKKFISSLKFRNLNELSDMLLFFNHSPFFHSFSFRGQKWQGMTLNLTLTSSCMKNIYTLMSDRVVNFVNVLSEISSNKSDVDMEDVFFKYWNDIITTCSSEIKVDSKSDFINNYLHGKEATSFIEPRSLKFLFFRTFSIFFKFFRLKYLSDVINFFKDIIKITFRTSGTEGKRSDIIQVIKEFSNYCKNEEKLSITDMIMLKSFFSYDIFHMSSIAIFFIAHKIAINSDVQTKLRQEIDEAIENSNGEVTYEALNRLKYLDAVVNEVLRLYPPVVFIQRQCERAYELPPTLPNGKSVILKKNQLIWIPVYAIHRDEKRYDEPDKFYPERFLGKDANNFPCHLSFGSQSRMCTVNKFALLQIKIMVFHLLARCELKSCAKTTLPLKLSKKGLAIMPEGGFWLNVQRRNHM